MLNLLDKNTTIGAVTAELPGAGEVFERYGIDFCCGGHRQLSEVIREQGLSEELIYGELDQLRKERESSYQGISFTEMNPENLTIYIEDTHHSYLRRALPEISELLNTILRVHGKKHKELFEVYRLFGTLKTDLEQHLLKEETMLFPSFEDEEDNRREIAELSEEIIREHEAAGEILTKLRQVTRDYNIPEDVCGTFIRTYESLIELEKDLHQHIHLENNVLLKEYDYRSKCSCK